eukprot:5991213-Amphidinium_carterae.1
MESIRLALLAAAHAWHHQHHHYHHSRTQFAQCQPVLGTNRETTAISTSEMELTNSQSYGIFCGTQHESTRVHEEVGPELGAMRSDKGANHRGRERSINRDTTQNLRLGIPRFWDPHRNTRKHKQQRTQNAEYVPEMPPGNR